MSEIQIPKSWSSARLADIVESDAPIVYGILQPGKDLGEGVKYIRPTEIDNDVIDVEALRYTTPKIAQKYQRSSLRADDVVLSIVGTIGKVAIVPRGLDGANITQSSARIRINKDVCSERYIAWALRSPILRTQFNQSRLGTAVPRLNLAQVRDLQIPIAPEYEQKRIVSKIEELSSDLDAGVSALKRARANLRRYRVSVLKSAVEGRLTAAWRSANSGIEPASELLARILRERRQGWEQQQRATYESKGKKPPKNWQSKYKEPSAPNNSNLPKLPNGWCWATVEQLGTINQQAVLTGPFGSSLGREDFLDEGVGVLTIGCLTSAGLIWEKANYVTNEKADELSRYRLETGDILFSRSASVGRVGFVTPEFAGCIVNYHLMRLRLAAEIIDPRFFMTWVRGSSVVVTYLNEVNHGATRDGINTKALLGMPVALPPIGEQAEIGNLVDVQSSNVHAIDLTITANECRSQKLRQCILKSAFQGQLLKEAYNGQLV